MGCSISCLSASAVELRKALKEGDERVVIRNLEAFPSLLSSRVSMLSLAATTPLHVACKRKQIEAVREALHFLSNSSLRVVREALHAFCRRTNTPLPSSVPEGVRMAVNMVNARGQTPLMYACFAGCPDLVRLLLEHGADPWVGDRYSRRTPLHYSAIGGHPACIRALLEHTPAALRVRNGRSYVDASSDVGLTPLHYAVYTGDMACVVELLRHNPDVNAATTSDVYVTCEGGSTALHFAAVRGSMEEARELLQYYARCMVSDPGSVPDPRTRVNAKSQMPWQVAVTFHSDNMDLITLLHPNRNIHAALRSRLVTAVGGTNDPRVGPPSLAAIAATALRAKLLAEVVKADSRRADAAAGGGKTTASSVRRVAIATVVTATKPTGAGAHVPYNRCSGWSNFSEEWGGVDGGGEGGRESGGGVTDADKEEGGLAMEGATSGCGHGHECANSDCAVGGGSGGGAAGTGTGTASGAGTGTASGAGTGTASGAGTGGVSGMSALRLAEVDEEEDEEELCGVCLAAPKAVASAGCGHGLCGDCAAKLCGGIQAQPLKCPFCRQSVAGFVVVVARGAVVEQQQQQQRGASSGEGGTSGGGGAGGGAK